MLACLVSACASAGRDNPGTDGNPGTDSMMGGEPGMMMVDAMPDASIMTTLSQTTSNTNTSSNSVTCSSGEDSWYRVFPLSDFGITGAFNVQSVTFGAQEATGSPTVQVKIGTYAGTPGTTLDTAMITPINSMTKVIPNQTNPGGNINVPITGTIPKNGKLIVEIYKPGANSASQYFFIGASNAGETKTGYIRAPTCNDTNGTPMTQPVTPTAAGLPTAQINIVVTGTH